MKMETASRLDTNSSSSSHQRCYCCSRYVAESAARLAANEFELIFQYRLREKNVS